MDKSKTYKYAPLICKLFNLRWKRDENSSSKTWEFQINEIKISLDHLSIPHENLNDKEIMVLNGMLDFYTKNFFTTINDFIDYVEKNKIPNCDLSTYNTLVDIEQAISLADIKEMDKELQLQVVKEFEDENWVVVRPLSFSASSRYGSGTRWCTTYKKEKHYFERYWRNGILVYFINKKTGYKFAMYKEIEEGNDLSFWTADDTRTDFLNLFIDDYLFPVVKKILTSKKSNRDFCSDELKKSVSIECDDNSLKKETTIDWLRVGPTVEEQMEPPIYEPDTEPEALQDDLRARLSMIEAASNLG